MSSNWNSLNMEGLVRRLAHHSPAQPATRRACRRLQEWPGAPEPTGMPRTQHPEQNQTKHTQSRRCGRSGRTLPCSGPQLRPASPAGASAGGACERMAWCDAVEASEPPLADAAKPSSSAASGSYSSSDIGGHGANGSTAASRTGLVCVLHSACGDGSGRSSKWVQRQACSACRMAASLRCVPMNTISCRLHKPRTHMPDTRRFNTTRRQARHAVTAVFRSCTHMSRAAWNNQLG